MQIIILVILLAMTLISCSLDFKVKRAYTRFSEHKNTLFLADNNPLLSTTRLFLENGVYLNPFVEKNRTTNEVIVLGFNIINKGYSPYGHIREIDFRLAGGEIITLYISNHKRTSVRDGTIFTFDSQLNVTGSHAQYEIWETANATLSEDDFKKLLSSKSFTCAIFGSERSLIYEKSFISSEFLDNLHLFYEQYVK